MRKVFIAQENPPKHEAKNCFEGELKMYLGTCHANGIYTCFPDAEHSAQCQTCERTVQLFVPSIEQKRLVRKICETRNNLPVKVILNSAKPPTVKGESYYYTNKSGDIIRYPVAYAAGGGKPIYHCSTERVEVGEWFFPAISATGIAHGYGSDPYKWVSGLTKQEQKIVKAGGIVLVGNCPAANGRTGTTFRQVHYINRRYVHRVPSNEILSQVE